MHPLIITASAYVLATVGVLIVTIKPLSVLILHGKSINNGSSLVAVIRWVHKLTVPKLWFAHFYVFLMVGMILIELTSWMNQDLKTLIQEKWLELWSMPILRSLEEKWMNIVYAFGVEWKEVFQYLGLWKKAIQYLSMGTLDMSQLLMESHFLDDIRWDTTHRIGTMIPSHYKSIKLIHILLLIQGIRRTYESYVITKFLPTSRINILHYIMGMAHYIGICVITAILLESIGPCRGWYWTITYTDIFLVGVFLYASVDQWQNHAHLASLPKYSLPMFESVALPHYANEVQLYGVLFLLSMGTGNKLVGANYLACLVFVAVNLSISSMQSLDYYRANFKECKFRWAIFKGVL